MSDNEIIEAEFCDDEDGIENPPVPFMDTTTIDDEFNCARINNLKIINKSMEVIDNTAALARDTDHPKMVEVYIELIKAVSELNKDLLALRKTKMELTGELITPTAVPSKSSGPRSVTNNAIFIGSSEELLNKIKSL